ncbi:MAG: hypothetical protein V3S55_14905 [Nitrospiraceae bacterium]
MKINILVPTHDVIPAMFAYDLGQLMSYTTNEMPKDTAIGLAFVTGTYIHKARQELMLHALEDGDDYILWLDSDMRFPRETLHALLQHRVTMVGANYAKRSLPTEPVAIKHIGDGEHPAERLHQTPFDEDMQAEGLVEVESIGFGAVLMRMDKFHALPPLTEGPWFDQVYHADTDEWYGEDVNFCRLIRKKLGIKIFVDRDLSRVMGHIGQFDYMLDAVPERVEA